MLSEPSYIVNDPTRLKLFTNAQDKLVPDPSVYSEWFAAADERRRKVAVGARRYSLVKGQLSAPWTLSWEHFIDPETGSLVPEDRLQYEDRTERDERIAKVRSQIVRNREQIRQLATYGFERQGGV